MSVKIDFDGETLYCRLSGEIDHHTALPIRLETDDRIENSRPRHTVLDFSEVTFMDSSGIGLVMGRYRNLQRMGGKVHIGNPPEHIYKLFSMCAIEKIATIDKPKGKERERCFK